MDHPVALQTWEYLCQHIAAVLSMQDQIKLARFCDAVADYVDARKTIAAVGYWVENERTGALGRHPVAIKLDKATDVIRQLGSDFGLDPAARARVAAPKEQEKDELAALLNQG